MAQEASQGDHRVRSRSIPGDGRPRAMPAPRGDSEDARTYESSV